MLRYLPLLLALFCWSWPPVIARHLGLGGIDVFTQNVVRMSASAVVFIPLAFYFRPVEMKDAARRWRRFILPALFLALAQTCWYYGLLKIGATFSSLLGRTDILLTVLVVVLFFADEREVVSRRGFVPALILTIIGVVGVILFRKGATGRVETNIAAFRDITAQVIGDLGQLAHQFDSHGRDLVKAVEIIDHSNQHADSGLNERRVQLDSLVATLDIRTEDLMAVSK